MRKLRLLGRSEDIPQNRVIAKTRKYMLAIGNAIVNVGRCNGSEGPTARELWDFVSEFTENTCPGSNLASLYSKLVAKRATAASDDPAEPTAGASSPKCNGATEAHDAGNGGAGEAPAVDAVVSRRNDDGDEPGSKDQGGGAKEPQAGSSPAPAGSASKNIAQVEPTARTAASDLEDDGNEDDDPGDPGEAEELLAAVAGTGARFVGTGTASTAADEAFNLSEEGDDEDGGDDENGSDDEWQGD
jgi:hypothetical protein